MSATSASLEALVEALAAPRVVWVMVPPARRPPRPSMQLAELLAAGDVDRRRRQLALHRRPAHADAPAEQGIGFVDVGVSGGVWGLTNGYALMVGGDDDARRAAAADLRHAQARGRLRLRARRRGRRRPLREDGAQRHRVRPDAGLRRGLGADGGRRRHHRRARGRQVLAQGTVIRSWLLDLLVRALDEDADLSELRGYAEDSGEGRWTVQAAIDHAVPLPVITAALFARFASRQDDRPAMKVIAALRNQFGGHAVTPRPARREGRGRPGRRRHGAGRRLICGDRQGEPGQRRRVHRPVEMRCTRSLSLTDFRSSPRWSRAGAGADALVGPERPGQDQPGRGARLRRDPRQPPGRRPTRRWSGRAPSARSIRARSSATSARRWSSSRSTRARPTGPGSTAAAVPRAREVLGVLRTVLFAPEDLALVKGDPSERRRFLDDLLVVRTPRLAGVRADYERVLKQRNALLKTRRRDMRSGGGDMRTLDVWDAHLAQAGAELLAGPVGLVEALAPLVDEGLRRGLRRRQRRRAAGLQELARARGRRWRPDRELLAGRAAARRWRGSGRRSWTAASPWSARTATTWCCRSGPLPARGYASHGESWSFALALRLASYELLRADGGVGRAGAGARRRVRRARHRPARAAGRLVGRRRAGAGHRRGAGRRARGAGRGRYDVHGRGR